MKFRKKGQGGKPKKVGHSSPMQKRDWAKGMTLDDATVHLITHVEKGAAWSGNDLVYLNALWDATVAVAKAQGYVDGENN